MAARTSSLHCVIASSKEGLARRVHTVLQQLLGTVNVDSLGACISFRDMRTSCV
jgi:hypothetical protein